MSSLYKNCRNILPQFYSLEIRQRQKRQTLHCLKLIRFWRLPPGAKVLEIDCGQGDTLAALCFAVGKNGFVHGVDISPAGMYDARNPRPGKGQAVLPLQSRKSYH